MKKHKIIFWVTTILFSAFMTLSAIPDILILPEAVSFMEYLGYPRYIIPFIGVAKLLGVIGILIPKFPRIKEWAYAGLFYDLLGATYSGIATGGFKPQVLITLLAVTFLLISYFLFRKLQTLKIKTDGTTK